MASALINKLVPADRRSLLDFFPHLLLCVSGSSSSLRLGHSLPCCRTGAPILRAAAGSVRRALEGLT